MAVSAPALSDLFIKAKGYHSLLTWDRPIILPKKPDHHIPSTPALELVMGSAAAKLILGDLGDPELLQEQLCMVLSDILRAIEDDEGNHVLGRMNTKEARFLLNLVIKYLGRDAIRFDDETDPRPWDDCSL
jgi:hypothetical protein